MPNGGCGGSASITTSRSRRISTVSPTAFREQLEVRITAHTVELFRKGERVAAHLRAGGNDRQRPCRTYAVAIGATPTGRSSALAARRRRSVPATPACRADPGAPAAPRAGLPLLPRHCPPAAAVWRRSPRSGSDRAIEIGTLSYSSVPRSSSTGSTAPPKPARRAAPALPTSAGPATTIEEIDC